MKKITKILSIILTVCLLTNICPVMVSAGGEGQKDYFADDTKLWIDSTTPTIFPSEFTDIQVINGNGWTFEPRKGVLTLNGFHGKFLLSDRDLIIVLKDGTTNTIEYGICSEGSLAICGDGILNLGQRLEVADGGLTIAGGTVNLEKKELPSFEIELEILHMLPAEWGVPSSYESCTWDLSRDYGFHGNNTGVSLGRESWLKIRKGELIVKNTYFGIDIRPEENDEKSYIAVDNGKLFCQDIEYNAIYSSWSSFENPSALVNNANIKDVSGNKVSLQICEWSTQLMDASGSPVKSAIIEVEDPSVSSEVDLMYGKYYLDPEDDPVQELPSEPEENEKPSQNEKPEEMEFTSSAGSLTTRDYLAFSALAYWDWKNGQTVEDGIKARENPLFNKRFIENLKTLKKSQREIDFYSINYEELCENILDWEVLTTSAHQNGNYEAGFYAVTFYSKTLKQAVIAYRGSESIVKMISDDHEAGHDANNDWLYNDIPFHVFHVFTEQLSDAMEYWQHNVSQEELIGTNISVTGHSLGGALAETAIMTNNGIYGQIFNAASPYEALYSERPEVLGENFRGVNNWNFIAHVHEGDSWVGRWDDEYLNLPYILHPASISSNKHALESLIYREDSNGQLRMANIKDYPSKPESFFRPFMAEGVEGLYLGTSNDDGSLMKTKNWEAVRRFYLYGGLGDDKLIVPYFSDDTLVGGSATTVDVLDGGWGDDTYIYYKGNGMHFINDAQGRDTLKILGLSEDDTVEVLKADGLLMADQQYQVVLINEEPCICINNSRYREDVFRIEALNKSFEINGAMKCPIGFYACCPVDIDIIDPSGNTVLTLKDGEEMTEFTNYGTFYVFADENGEYCKRIDLETGYTVKIRGVGEGTMDFAVIGDCGNPDMSSTGAVAIPITPTFTATIKTTSGEKPQLIIDNGGTVEEITLVPQKVVTFDANGGSCTVKSLKTDFGGKLTELPIATRKGYVFAGWESAEGVLISTENTFEFDTTLFARWTSAEQETPDASQKLGEVNDDKMELWWIAIIGVAVALFAVAGVVLVKKKRK